MRWIRRLAPRSARQLVGRAEGQGTLEYVLIIALVVVVILGLIWLLREQIGNIVQWATDTIQAWFSQANQAPGT